MTSSATSLLLSAADVKAIDALTGDVAALMERAGEEIAKALLALKGRFVFLIGQGNNGGDGLVAARILHAQKIACTVVCVEAPRSELACRQYRLAQDAGVVFAQDLTEDLGDIFVDCLYGVGFRPPVTSENVLKAMRTVKKIKRKHVVAVDLPSGLCADTRAQGDDFIVADQTLAIDCYKFAHLSTAVGKVDLLDIGIPEALKVKHLQGRASFLVKSDPCAMGAWKNVGDDIHKFARGHVVVIGGSDGNDGAVAISSMAAYRGGAGWVTTGLLKDRDSPDELVYADLQKPDFAIDVAKLAAYISSKKVSAVVVGPGWLRSHLDEDAMELLANLSRSQVSIVFDGGALHGIAPFLEKFTFAPSHTILLPHPGEWVKMGFTWSTHALDSYAELTAAADSVFALGRAAIVYKDVRPIVFSGQDRRSVILSSPSRRLARAGTGDVLAGATAALTRVSQDAGQAFERAYGAVLRASLEASTTYGEDSLLASDYLPRLGAFL